MSVERREVRVTNQPATTPNRPGYERRVDVVKDPNAWWRSLVARFVRLIWLLAGILIVLIGIHVVLVLIAANPASGFATIINNLTGLFLRPFAGLTAMPTVGASGHLDVPAIIAMFVFAFIAWVIVEITRVLFAPGRSRTVQRVSTIRRGR